MTAPETTPDPRSVPSVLNVLVDGARLVLQHPRLLFASSVVVALVLVLASATFIPYAAIVTIPLMFAFGLPALAGLSGFFLRTKTGDKPRVRELLRLPMSRRSKTTTAYVLLLFSTMVACIPGIALFALGVGTGSQASDLTSEAAGLLLAGVLLTVVLGITPWAVFGLAPGLIQLRGVGLRESIALSRRITWHRPIRSFEFAMACVVLILGGALLFGVGLFLAVPWVAASRAELVSAWFDSLACPSAPTAPPPPLDGSSAETPDPTSSDPPPFGA